MDHLLFKAATQATTDKGIFEAVISTATADRERDVVEPEAMVVALQKWAESGKLIPLAWNHSEKADEQVGHIDPGSARVQDGEVVVKGWVDQSIEVGQHVWRLVKSGTLGFSFGYLILKDEELKGGGRHITELDVFEVTATPTPMNNDTRVLGYKQMAGGVLRVLNSMIGEAKEYIEAEPDKEDAEEMEDVLETLEALLSKDRGEGEKSIWDMTLEESRRKAEGVQRDLIKDRHSEAFDTEIAEKELPAELVKYAAVETEAMFDLLPSHDKLAIYYASLGSAGEEAEQKAEWSAAYVNELPDSCFLYIESGGEKDSEGKTTPRSLRYFPVKDKEGAIDLPHLRNALARIPQSNLSQSVKDRLAAMAQRMLDSMKSVAIEDAGEEPEGAKPKAQDPLRRRSLDLALEVHSAGLSRRQPSRPAKEEPEPVPSRREIKRLSREAMLEALRG